MQIVTLPVEGEEEFGIAWAWTLAHGGAPEIRMLLMALDVLYCPSLDL